MSVLSAEVGNALIRLLNQLSSPENDARASAEEQLHAEWVSARPDILLMGLVEQIQNSQEPAVRILLGLRPYLSQNMQLTSAVIVCRYVHSRRYFSGASQPNLESFLERRSRKSSFRPYNKRSVPQSGRSYWNAFKMRRFHT